MYRSHNDIVQYKSSIGGQFYAVGTPSTRLGSLALQRLAFICMNTIRLKITMNAGPWYLFFWYYHSTYALYYGYYSTIIPVRLELLYHIIELKWRGKYWVIIHPGRILSQWQKVHAYALVTKCSVCVWFNEKCTLE